MAGHIAPPYASTPSLDRARGIPRVWQRVILIAGVGVAAAALDHLLGRAFHLLWPIPTSGSIAVALPRTLLFLLLATRIRSFGVLTGAALAEVGTRLAMGSVGLMPWFLAVPLLAGFLGDVAWAGFTRVSGRRACLVLTGATLAATRVLAALAFWGLFSLSHQTAQSHIALLLGGIVVLNVLLGAVAGLIAIPSTRPHRKAGAA